MRIAKLMTCAALAAMLAASAIPTPAAAQIGGMLRKKLRESAEKMVAGTDSPAVAQDPSAPARPGPGFNDHVLEITPELLDRLEKGLAAEKAARQQIELQIGKVLSRDEYEECEAAVLRSPEGLKVYEQSMDLVTGDTSYERMQQASQELARRMEQVIEPRCGLEPRKAEAIRSQNADRVAAAARDGSGLTQLQLSILKERILPLCAATQAEAVAGGDVRIPAGPQTDVDPVYYVYTPGEVEALQPRCARLAIALRAAS